MQNSTYSDTQNLGVFGWNWSFLGDIQLKTDNEGNVTLLNSGIQSLLPQQRSGTVLYETSTAELPPEQLVGNSYSASILQLLAQGSGSNRQFHLQTDGSYQGHSNDKGILSKEGEHYQLREKDGTVIVFRPDGQLNYVEDANGYRITAEYTGDLLTNISASNGNSFTISYNDQGRISTITDQTGQTTTYAYDLTGQFLSSIENSTGTTSFTYGHPYDPTALTSITYADGSQVTYDYDEFGRLQQAIQGEGREALAYTYTYNATGGYTLTDPSGASTTVEYNDDQSQTVTDSLGRVFQYNYDAAGRLDTVIGPDGYQVDYNFCSCGQLRSLIDPLGNQITFDYEPNFGKISSFTDAKGNELRYGYDAQGNLEIIIYKDGSQQRYDYDDTNGLLTQSINRRNRGLTTLT